MGLYEGSQGDDAVVLLKEPDLSLEYFSRDAHPIEMRVCRMGVSTNNMVVHHVDLVWVQELNKRK